MLPTKTSKSTPESKSGAKNHLFFFSLGQNYNFFEAMALTTDTTIHKIIIKDAI
jgi:hypothetical protein